MRHKRLSNVRMDGGKKNRKGKKDQKGNEEMQPDITPSKALTSHPPSTVGASDKKLGEDAIDVSARE